jgi:hypothetical protein
MEKSLLAEEASEEPAWCAFLTLRPGSFEGVLVSSKPCRYGQDPIGWKDVVLVRVFFLVNVFWLIPAKVWSLISFVCGVVEIAVFGSVPVVDVVKGTVPHVGSSSEGEPQVTMTSVTVCVFMHGVDRARLAGLH